MISDVLKGGRGAITIHIRNIGTTDTFADRGTNRLTGAKLQATTGDNVLRKRFKGSVWSGGRDGWKRGTSGKQLGQDGVSRASVNHLAGRLHSE